MSQREQNKQDKRKRIVAAATRIISKDGIEALNMRRLAEDANVSSRTPYNLFDSKTDILFAIMIETIKPFERLELNAECGLATQELLQVLEVLLSLDKTNENFLRSVHWSIMRSDDMESKSRSRTALNKLIAEYVNKALEQGELKKGCDTEALAVHISTLLTSILGMWADSQLTLHETVSHTRHAWINSLLPHARGKGLKFLNENRGSSFLAELPQKP